MEKDRRQFYRIKYPENYRPTIVIQIGEKEERYAIIDISERGVRLTGEMVSWLRPMSRIEAQIIFFDGESLDVEGEVLRNSENQVAIYLPDGIPLSRMRREHQLLSSLHQY